MLKMRIQILKQGGIIAEDVAEFMNQVIDMMAADYSLVLGHNGFCILEDE